MLTVFQQGELKDEYIIINLSVLEIRKRFI